LLHETCLTLSYCGFAQTRGRRMTENEAAEGDG